jgi:tripartite-type tricarboxylate transporter receptor subunit TctC
MVVQRQKRRRMTTMKMKKRPWIGFAFLSVLVISVSMFPQGIWAGESNYPSSPIEFVCAQVPGGWMDIINRITARYVEKYLKVSAVPVNKPGAGGVAAFNYLVNARPNGYTVANFGTSMLINHILGQATYPLEDVHVVARIADAGNVLGVSADAPWKTFQDFMQYAKKNPGVKVACLAPGSVAFLRLENINNYAKLGLIAVPYKGDGEAIPAVLGKHVPIGVFSTSGVMPQVAAGKIRAIFSYEKPSAMGIDPSISDFASVFGDNLTDITMFNSLVVHAKTPIEIIQILERTIEKIAKDPGYINELKKNYLMVNYVDGKTYREKQEPKIIAQIKAVAQSAGLLK